MKDIVRTGLYLVALGAIVVLGSRVIDKLSRGSKL